MWRSPDQESEAYVTAIARLKHLMRLPALTDVVDFVNRCKFTVDSSSLRIEATYSNVRNTSRTALAFWCSMPQVEGEIQQPFTVWYVMYGPVAGSFEVKPTEHSHEILVANEGDLFDPRASAEIMLRDQSLAAFFDEIEKRCELGLRTAHASQWRPTMHEYNRLQKLRTPLFVLGLDLQKNEYEYVVPPEMSQDLDFLQHRSRADFSELRREYGSRLYGDPTATSPDDQPRDSDFT